MKTVIVGDSTVQQVTFSNSAPMALLSGTCAIESRDITMRTAESLKDICDRLNIGFVYKSSFDKANRTSSSGARGVGIDEGLKILQEVRDQFKVPVVTDVHESAQVPAVGEVVDILQIPAFLCRQTDLLMACGETGKTVNVKKGQFLSPEEMANIPQKIESTGNHNIMLCERGTTFGYNNLVVDMRGLQTMGETGYPVIFDATHSVMSPGGRGAASGGRREFVPALSRAAASVGVAGFFMEAHPNPTEAISDKETQMPLSEMEGLLATLKAYDQLTKEQQLNKVNAA